MFSINRYAAVAVLAGLCVMPVHAQTAATAPATTPVATAPAPAKAKALATETIAIPASEESAAQPTSAAAAPAPAVTPTIQVAADVKAPATPASPAAPVAAKVPAAPPMPASLPEAKAAAATESLESPGESLPAISPITYAKDQIILLPAKPLIENLKSGALFQVEVRNIGAALNPDWFQISGFPANHGLLLTYQNPQIIVIEPANIFAHYDIIAANQYGEIVLILPNIVLANLTEAIKTPQPANILLYVPGGTTSDIGLVVGDRLKHSMFLERTAVMDHVNETPAEAAEAPAMIEPAAAPVAAEAPAPAPAAVTPTPEVTKDPNGRRRPAGNPVIAKPTPPEVPHVAKPAKVVPVTTQSSSAPTNSNLQQSPAAIPPVQSAESAEQKSLLDIVLQRHHESN